MNQAHGYGTWQGEQPAPPALAAELPALTQCGDKRAVVEVTYYTDPLCSWSWAFEPQWRRLRYEYGEHLAWNFRMGGMIPNWEQYADPLNDVSRPVQMGPQWFQVRTLSGMPFGEGIWHKDPPASSYPACIAVKAAQRQGAAAGEWYLRRVREAAMVEEQNIARRETLLALAAEGHRDSVSLDVAAFQAALDEGTAQQDFRQDLQDVRYRAIGRFPTLILRHCAGGAVMLVGYRPYAALQDVLHRLAPELAPQRRADEIVPFVRHWGRVTLQEVAEALHMERSPARQALAQLVGTGELVEGGPFYAARSGM